MNALLLSEYRCKCGKLLLKGIFIEGVLEIKCKHCGQFNNFGTIKQPDDATHYLLILNDQGYITNVSDSACRVLGYDSSDLIGKNISQINPTLPKGILNNFFGLNSIVKDDHHFQLNTIHVSKNGKEIPVLSYLRLIKSTNKDMYILVLAEIKSEIKKNKFSKNDLCLSIDSCDFYFDLNKDGTEQYMSPSVEKIFGYSPEEVLGNNYFDYLPISKIIKSKKMIEDFIANGKPFRSLKDISKDANGKTIYNDLYFTPNINNSGKIIGCRVFGWKIKKSQKQKS